MDDKGLVAEMVQLFLENAPLALSNLKELSSKQNWKRFAEEAHKLKPNLAYMGMNQTKALLEEVEGFAKKKQQLGSIPSKIEIIDRRCQKAYAELREALKQIRPC